MTPTQTVIHFKAKAEGVFVRVPDEERMNSVVMYGVKFSDISWVIDDFGDDTHYVRFIAKGRGLIFRVAIPYSGEIYGLSSSLTESQWAEVVPSKPAYSRYYPRFINPAEHPRDNFYKTATESGLSLMRSLGITEGNWLVIIKKS